MLALFFISTLTIFAVGPLEIEGGRKAVEANGVKASVIKAIDEADASSLKGNYGNP